MKFFPKFNQFMSNFIKHITYFNAKKIMIKYFLQTILGRGRIKPGTDVIKKF